MFVWNDNGEIEVTNHIFAHLFVVEDEQEMPEDDGYSFEETDYVFPDWAA